MAGIYIHIPFCKTLCFYCDFYHVIYPGDVSGFLTALFKEASDRKEYLDEETVSTIYIGGGTPSVLAAKDIDLIINHLYNIYTVDDNCEITIELNPDDITYSYMKLLKKMNINRVSLGIQSWNDKELKMLNRRHDSAKAAKALRDIFRAGFENVSIDLIYGIPGTGEKDWASDIDFSLSFDIKHLSAYHLTIEEGTVLGKMLREGLISEIDESTSISMFNILTEKTGSAGFINYEISNFGKKGFFSQHNSNYWKQVNYIGLGPSAHSFNGYSRQWNISNVNDYIKLTEKGEGYFEKEELDLRKRFNEYVMTSLRTIWGIDLEYIERKYEKEGYDYIMNITGKFKNYGLLKQEGNSVLLTGQGKMIADNIISELMMPDDAGSSF